MATRYGKKFKTRKGKWGRYKYVNGRRVSFVTVKGKRYMAFKPIHRRKNWRFKRTYRERY